jgi:hypothetical protein
MKHLLRVAICVAGICALSQGSVFAQSGPSVPDTRLCIQDDVENCVPDHKLPACGSAAAFSASLALNCGSGPTGYEYTYCGEFDGHKTEAHKWCYRPAASRYYTENVAYYPYGSKDTKWEICAAFNKGDRYGETVRKDCQPNYLSAGTMYCPNASGSNDIVLATAVGNTDDRTRTINGYATDDEYASCAG